MHVHRLLGSVERRLLTVLMSIIALVLDWQLSRVQKSAMAGESRPEAVESA